MRVFRSFMFVAMAAGCTPAADPASAPDAALDPMPAPAVALASDVPHPVIPAEPVPPPVTTATPFAELCDPGRQTGTTGPVGVLSPAAPPSCPFGTSVIAWQDSVVDPSNIIDGVAEPDQRYACAPWLPPLVNSEPVPLVVYFTPSFTDAGTIYAATQLDAKSHSYAWPYATPSGLPATGFVFVVVQERNLVSGALGAGGHEDDAYRPLDPALNPDIRNADAVVDWAVAHYGNRIDRRRIYVSGWSNGAIFGQVYTIARHRSTQLAITGSRWGQPTPGGNYVAGAAVYSGDDPFAGLPSGDCGTRRYPTTRAPIYLSHRMCDLVACNESQQECEFGYASHDFVFTTGATSNLTVEHWLGELSATSGFHAMGDPFVVDTVLDGTGAHLPPGVASCQPSAGGVNGGSNCQLFSSAIPTPPDNPTPYAVSYVPIVFGGCTVAMGKLLHVIWPTSDETNMLAFLARFSS